MKQEDKELLLKDLCARLPYGVFVNIEGFDYDFNGKLVQVYFGNINRCYIQVGSNISYSLEETKPWLRPMSSMTEEERAEFYKVGGIMSHKVETDTYVLTAFSPEAYDWLNRNYFDYRGLIPKGHALEALEGMYKVEEQQ